MTVAHRWAFAHPLRRLCHNLTITGLSVAVALLIGTIALVGLLHWTDAVTAWVAGLYLGVVGFLVAGPFVVVWALAVGWWELGRVEARRTAEAAGRES